MPPKKNEKLNESPEINLIWTDDEDILKLREDAEVRPCLTQQFFLFFPKHISIFLHHM